MGHAMPPLASATASASTSASVFTRASAGAGTVLPKRMAKWFVALAAAALAQPLLAHDVWFEPATFTPALGQTVSLSLRVGEHLQGETVGLVAGMARQFVMVDAAGRRPVAEPARAAASVPVRVLRPGLQVVGFFGRPNFIELPAAKFNSYLADEGLEAVIEQRTQRGESGAPGREMYSRCAKTLLLAGTASETQNDRALGFPLELVAERNPYALAAGQELTVRLTYLDRPLQGALVVALNSVDASRKQSARTDADGRVRLRIQPGGLWLVKAVHMVPAPAGADAQWASYWASLTFEGRSVTP